MEKRYEDDVHTLYEKKMNTSLLEIATKTMTDPLEQWRSLLQVTFGTDPFPKIACDT